VSAPEGAVRSLLTAHEQLADPYGGFGRVREETRIARGMWGGGPAWFVTRHEDAVAVLSDPRFVGNTASLPGGTDDYAEAFRALGVRPELIPYMAGNLAALDPPAHTRLRGILSRALGVRRVAALRPRVEAIAAELLDALPGHAVDGVVDLVAHYAEPLSAAVQCELAGLPARDRPRWHGWTADYVSMDARRINAMLTEVRAHVLAEAERRRAEPADDLITELTRVRDANDGALSGTELVTLVLTVMVAGHKTTPHVVAGGVLALLTHPGQLALLRADPSLMPGAVREALRRCGPAIVARLRYATEDVTVGGTRIRRGDRVQVVLGAADHDPRRHPRPDRFDVTRRHDAGPAHVAYAHGAHRCAGAEVADQEIEVAFSALFSRYPRLALAVPPDRPTWRPLPFTRQLARLPVTLKDHE
jgi:cytochrome P450